MRTYSFSKVFGTISREIRIVEVPEITILVNFWQSKVTQNIQCDMENNIISAPKNDHQLLQM